MNSHIITIWLARLKGYSVLCVSRFYEESLHSQIDIMESYTECVLRLRPTCAKFLLRSRYFVTLGAGNRYNFELGRIVVFHDLKMVILVDVTNRGQVNECDYITHSHTLVQYKYL